MNMTSKECQLLYPASDYSSVLYSCEIPGHIRYRNIQTFSFITFKFSMQQRQLNPHNDNLNHDVYMTQTQGWEKCRHLREKTIPPAFTGICRNIPTFDGIFWRFQQALYTVNKYVRVDDKKVMDLLE